jgi:peptidyl-prolyl cis-trans isomerase A (cyclophilin A)
MKYGFDAVSIVKGAALAMVVAGLLFAAGCKEKPAEKSAQAPAAETKAPAAVKEQAAVVETKPDQTKAPAPQTPAKPAMGSFMAGNQLVTIKTSKGQIRIMLYQDKAPISVANFLAYVNSGFYNGTIFHRVIPGFMIQGGGMTPDMAQKPTRAPIKNEAANGLKNDRGTLAMARTNAPDSATSQFFINVNNNQPLNAGPGQAGYAVFGKVIEGMEVVDAIVGVPTHTVGMNADIPNEPIIIESMVQAKQ